jgi:hypothetical protein
MSFSLSLDHGKLEWSGAGLSSIFAQKRNLLRPSFLLMIREILRFNKTCLLDRAAGHLASRSIGDYLDWRGFSPGFTNNYLVPMAAAIWSTPAAKMMQFPAEHFVNFFDNHRLIYTRQHQWRTVTGGSRTYLDKLLAPLGDRLKLGLGVRSVIRSQAGVTVIDDSGEETHFDKVIFAAHSDQTRHMLVDATDQEQKASRSRSLSAEPGCAAPRPEADAAAPEGLGLVELSAFQFRGRQCRRGRHLLDEPAAGDRRPVPAVRDTEPGSRAGPAQGVCRIQLRPPAVFGRERAGAGVLWPICRDATTATLPEPGRAMVSTRTDFRPA